MVSLCVGGDYFQLVLHSLELLVLQLGFLQALLLEGMLAKYFILRPSPFGAHLQEHRADALGFYRVHNNEEVKTGGHDSDSKLLTRDEGGFVEGRRNVRVNFNFGVVLLSQQLVAIGDSLVHKGLEFFGYPGVDESAEVGSGQTVQVPLLAEVRLNLWVLSKLFENLLQAQAIVVRYRDVANFGILQN